MSEFFRTAYRSAAGFLENYLDTSDPNDPTSLLPIKKTDQYFKILRRDECLVLGNSANSSSAIVYEIIVMLPVSQATVRTTGYSFLRTSEAEIATFLYTTLKDVFLPLLEIDEEFWYQYAMLKKVWLYIRENPGVNAAHVASYFDHELSFGAGNITVLSGLSSCDEKMLTPLHTAVVYASTRTLIAMLQHSEYIDVAKCDKEGNTILHIAATLPLERLQIIIDKCTTVLSAQNGNNQTAFHLACFNEKFENAKTILQQGVDIHALTSPKKVEKIVPIPADILSQLTSEDIKNGGTPLHWCKSKAAVEALIELDCDINAQNLLGQTALHIMITRGRFDCVMMLLSYCASVNILDNDGNTALHVAAKRGHIPTVQAILAFSGPLDLLNNASETARHLAAHAPTKDRLVFIFSAIGAARCKERLKDCNPYCAAGGGNDGQMPKNFSRLANKRARFQLDELLTNAGNAAVSKDGLKLLCLDGGGIRGLVLIQMLKAIEEECSMPVSRLFDWIFGTSTGGILALALAKGKTVVGCLGLYFRLKGKVFVGSRPYDSENLEAFLSNEFGDSCHMTDIPVPPKVAVTAVLADRFPADLHLFRNYESAQDIIGIEDHGPYQPIDKPSEQLVWRAARSTGAAPTYFRAMGRFIDGGMIANNPTLDALTEVSEYNVALKAVNRDKEARNVGLVLSLGTGRFPLEEVVALDLYRPENLVEAARMAMNLGAFAKVLVESATMSDGRVIDRARAWCQNIEAAYFRLSPPLTEEVLLDETKDEVLVDMLWQTKVYIHRRKSDIRAFCRRLVANTPV